jgi:hypothetical protein
VEKNNIWTEQPVRSLAYNKAKTAANAVTRLREHVGCTLDMRLLVEEAKTA